MFSDGKKDNKSKAIIFDLDGTLWDSAIQVAAGWNDTFAEYGVDRRTTEDEIKSLMGRPMEAIIEALVPSIEENKRLVLLEKCCDKEHEYLLRKGGILFDGLEDTLQKLKTFGYHLSIVSNCQDGYIETFLEYHKMQPLFDDYECPGRSGVLKAENIRLVMERNNIEQAVYVGDTQGDLDACRKAGVPFIFARYGFGNVDDETNAIDSLDELPETVRKVFSEM